MGGKSIGFALAELTDLTSLYIDIKKNNIKSEGVMSICKGLS